MKKITAIICLILFVSSFSFAGSTVYAAEETVSGELSLDCKAAALINFDTGEVLYEYNAYERLPEASITKIMTLLLVFEALDCQEISRDDVVTCSEHAASMGGSQIWLEPGETMTVHELIKAVAVGSANDAAVALAEHVAGSHEAFVALMNERARELGMAQTAYKNCTGLDAEGHLTSAMDIALVSRELMRHDGVFEYTTIWMDSLRNGELELANTNKLLKQYEGANGLKTGTTSQAGCCVAATAKRDGVTMIAVVMGAPNSKTRFSCAQKLLDHAFAGWELVDTSTYAPQLPAIAVEGGVLKELSLACDMEGVALIEKGQSQSLEASVTLDENVAAPVEAGQRVGTVSLKYGDEVIDEFAVITTQGTEKVTFGKAFELIMKGLLCL